METMLFLLLIGSFEIKLHQELRSYSYFSTSVLGSRMHLLLKPNTTLNCCKGVKPPQTFNVQRAMILLEGVMFLCFLVYELHYYYSSFICFWGELALKFFT